jgi:MSHA biogenesis protein MshK
MVKHLSRLKFVAALLALSSAGAAYAENLPDPTRPPAELSAPASAPGGAVVKTGPVLQSVQISPSSRSAIISGQRVVQGDVIGDARVVKISESEVVLKSGSEIKTLKLFPGVEKRVSKTAERKSTQRKAK